MLEHPSKDPHRSQAITRAYALCVEAVARDATSPDDPRPRELERRYVQSALDGIRHTLRLQPDMALDVLGGAELNRLRRRGILQSFVRELGRSTAPGDAKR